MRKYQFWRNSESDGDSQARDLCIILLFSILITEFAKAIVSRILSTPDTQFYTSIAAKCVMYWALIWFSIKYLRLTKASSLQIIGRAKVCPVVFACGLGMILFGFMHGQTSLEAWILAQVNPELAYALWPFHPNQNPAWDSFSTDFVLFLIVMTVVAPTAEEFFFRGLLFTTFAKCMSIHRAALSTAFIFIIVHPQHLHVVGTLVFSISLSYMYMATRSVGLCAIAHGVFNLMAVLNENFLLSHMIRTQDQMHLPQAWYPEFSLWLFSATIIGFGFYRYRASGSSKTIFR